MTAQWESATSVATMHREVTITAAGATATVSRLHAAAHLRVTEAGLRLPYQVTRVGINSRRRHEVSIAAEARVAAF